MSKPNFPQSVVETLPQAAVAVLREGPANARVTTRAVVEATEAIAARLRLEETAEKYAVRHGEIADLNAARKTIHLQQDTIEQLKAEIVEIERRQLAEKAAGAMAVHSNGSQR